MRLIRFWSRLLMIPCLASLSLGTSARAQTPALSAHLTMLTGVKNLVSGGLAVTSQGQTRGHDYPGLAERKVAIAEVPWTFTLSFKFTPDSLAGSRTLAKTTDWELVQNGAQLVSRLRIAAGSYDTITLSNGLFNRSCNHFAVSISPTRHTAHVNGTFIDHSLAKSGTGAAATLALGPYPGNVWDVKIFDGQLANGAITALGDRCWSDKIGAPPDTAFPKPLCGAYICLWGRDTTDFSEERFQYYLHAQEMVYRHNLFEAKMHPAGQEGLEKYVHDPKKGISNLGMHDGIVRTFVSDWSFAKNPLKRENSNYWVHENFHSYQGSLGGAQGFGGGKFLAESTAEWAPDATFPGATSTLLAYYTLHPHFPLYSTQDAPVEGRPGWEFIGGHQYGAYIFWSYITNHVLDKTFMGALWNTKQTKGPIAATYDLLKAQGHDLKEVFADFAGRTILFDYANSRHYQDSERQSLNRMKGAKKDAKVFDAKVIGFHGVKGTEGKWVKTPAGYEPGAWAYNVFNVKVDKDTGLKFEFKGDPANPAHADFRARVVVAPKDTSKPKIHHAFPGMGKGVAKGSETSLSIRAAAGDSVFLVIAAVPDTFDGFQVYHYQYKVSAIATAGITAIGKAQTQRVGNGIRIALRRAESVHLQFAMESPGAARVEIRSVATGRLLVDRDLGWRDAGTHEITLPGLGLSHGALFLARLRIGGMTRSARLLALD